MTVTGGGFTPGLTATSRRRAADRRDVTPTSFMFIVPQGTFCAAPLVVTLPDTQTATLNGVNPAADDPDVIGPPGVPSGGSSFFVLGSNFHPGTTRHDRRRARLDREHDDDRDRWRRRRRARQDRPLVVTSAAGCGAASTYIYQ